MATHSKLRSKRFTRGPDQEGHRSSLSRDEGLSGTKDETQRPGLARALTLIQEGEADALCVDRLDRLARALHVKRASSDLSGKLVVEFFLLWMAKRCAMIQMTRCSPLLGR